MARRSSTQGCQAHAEEGGFVCCWSWQAGIHAEQQVALFIKCQITSMSRCRASQLMAAAEGRVQWLPLGMNCGSCSAHRLGNSARPICNAIMQ